MKWPSYMLGARCLLKSGEGCFPTYYAFVTCGDYVRCMSILIYLEFDLACLMADAFDHGLSLDYTDFGAFSLTSLKTGPLLFILRDN